METFTIEITKVIVVDVEAESYEDACLQLDKGRVPDIGQDWSRAEPRMMLLSKKSVVDAAELEASTAPLTAASCFGAPLVLFDHGHIQTPAHAARFKTGEIALPGQKPEYVGVKFHSFQFNAMQKRDDAVFAVDRKGKFEGFFFASAFKTLCL